MELEFASAKLRKRCETRREAVRAWGDECAGKLFQRLAELEDAESLAIVAKLPGARCHELKGDRAGEFAVDLKHPKRLVFRPAGDSRAFMDGNTVMLDRVTSIVIEEVVDYHD
jgi:toxin HigB-1